MTMMFYFLMLKQYQHSFIHLSFLINFKKKKQSQLSITHTSSKHYLSLLPIMQREINEFFLLLITNQINLLWSKNIYLWFFLPPEKIIWNHACDKMNIIDWGKNFLLGLWISHNDFKKIILFPCSLLLLVLYFYRKPVFILL